MYTINNNNPSCYCFVIIYDEDRFKLKLYSLSKNTIQQNGFKHSVTNLRVKPNYFSTTE